MVRTTTQLFQGTPKLMLIINETQLQPKTEFYWGDKSVLQT